MGFKAFRVWGLGFRVWGLGFNPTLNPVISQVIAILGDCRIARVCFFGGVVACRDAHAVDGRAFASRQVREFREISTALRVQGPKLYCFQSKLLQY